MFPNLFPCVYLREKKNWLKLIRFVALRLSINPDAIYLDVRRH